MATLLRDQDPKDFAIVVGRVSDAIQTSIPQQHRQMAACAKSLGVPIPEDGYYADIQSRSKGLETREDLQAALRRARDPHCRVVIFFDDSRLIGNPAQALELYQTLQRTGVRVFYANGSEENVQDRIGLLMMLIKGWQNEGEVIRLRERVKNNLRDRATEKRMISRAPFGVRAVPLSEAACKGDCKGDAEGCWARHGELSKKNTVWIVQDEEVRLLTFMYEWIAAGKSWGSLERELERRGERKPVRQLKRPKDPDRLGDTVGGGQWDKASMRRLLISPFYRGVFIWGETEVDRTGDRAYQRARPEEERISFEHSLGPLVDPDLWWRAYDQIERRTKTREQSRAYPTLLWDGFVFCGRCGWKMYPRLRVNGTKTIRYDYVCPSKLSRSSKRRCKSHHMIPEVWLDWCLGAQLPAQGRRIPNIVAGFSTTTQKADSRAEIQRIKTLLSELDEQEERVGEERIRGKIKPEFLDAQMARIETERVELSFQLGQLQAIPDDVIRTAGVPDALARLMTLLRSDCLTIDEARLELTRLIDRVIVDRPSVSFFLLDE